MPDRLLARVRHIVFALLLLLGLAPEQASAIEGPPIFGSSGGSGSSAASGLLGEGIDFKGGMLDWEEDDEGNRVAILRNYAVVILPQLTISARNIVLNVEQQELYAEGDVLFNEASGNSFYCDQLTFNYEEWNGLAKNIRIKMDREGVEIPVRDFLDERPSILMSAGGGRSLNEPGRSLGQMKRMYVQAEELRAHDHNTFELIDAKVTPSSFARPHWYFHSPAALYRQKEKIESYHNTVRVGRVPVLYFPYLIRDLQYDWPWMRVEAGHTSDYGYYVKSQWGWRFKDNPDAFFRMDKLIFDVDLFTRRGAGLGLETTYEVGDWDSFGKIKAYGVSEFLTSRSRDRDRAAKKNEDRIYSQHPDYRPSLYRGDFRWALDWEHYQQLNELWDVRAEAHLYHDRDYLKEYDPTRYWQDKEPENSIVVRRLDKNWELEFVASSRLSNKWMNQADYLPEARLTVPAVQIGDSNFFFKNDMRIGVVNRRVDEDLFKYDDDGWDLYNKDSFGTFFRAFNEMRVEAPFKLGSFALKPWVGLRTAYYSKTRDAYLYQDPSTSERETRYGGGKSDTAYAIPLGLEASTRMYTLFGNSDQWRLITEPKFKWTENTRSHTTDLFPVDSYDEYQRQRRFSYELAMKLQKRIDGGGTTKDLVDFSMGFHQYPRSRDRNAVNHGAHWSELTADAVVRLNENLSLSGSLSYDLDDSHTNRAILSADWRLNNKWRTYVTHYTYRGHYWAAPNSSPSSQTHLAVRTKLWNDSSRYSLEGAVAYEWKDSDNWRNKRDGVRHGFSKYRATLFRDLDTFEMSVSYIRERNADNHGVQFNLAPKSFMGYDRPPPQYNMEVQELSEGRYASHTRHFLDDGYRIDAPVRDAEIKDIQF